MRRKKKYQQENLTPYPLKQKQFRNLKTGLNQSIEKKTLMKEVREGTKLHTIFTENGMLPGDEAKEGVEEGDAYKEQKVE